MTAGAVARREPRVCGHETPTLAERRTCRGVREPSARVRCTHSASCRLKVGVVATPWRACAQRQTTATTGSEEYLPQAALERRAVDTRS